MAGVAGLEFLGRVVYNKRKEKYEKNDEWFYDH